MRTIRTLVAGAACIALLPAVGFAQNGRSFTDSWFWGAKGGVTTFESASERVTAPHVGAEWLITRSRVALAISVEQAFFETVAGVFDPTSVGSVRAVDVADLRRYHMGLMLFPKRFGALRPYGGLGLAINVVQDAAPRGSFTSPASQDTIFRRVDDQSSRASLVVTAGLQAQYSRVSVFGQLSSMATRSNFLLNGSANTFMLEGGIRYNLVGAIESLKK